MEFPEVPNEKATKTALKAYLKMMEDDEAWHKDILHIQKDHKQILFSLAEGAKLQGMHEDPLDVLIAELKAGPKADFGQPQPKVVELGPDSNPKKAPETVETQKKSVGAFSFLGSDEKQKKLVEDFINRNKKQPEPAASVPKEEKPQEPKVEESKEHNDHKEEVKVDDHKEEDKVDDHKEVKADAKDQSDKHAHDGADNAHQEAKDHTEPKPDAHHEQAKKEAHHEEPKQDVHHKEHKDHEEPKDKPEVHKAEDVKKESHEGDHAKHEEKDGHKDSAHKTA